MNIFAQYNALIIGELQRMIDAGEMQGVDLSRVAVEPPRDPAHGDLATNAAMVLAKPAGMPPRDLAAKLASGIQNMPDVAAVEIAGPGFINIRLKPEIWTRVLSAILKAGNMYGATDAGARLPPINIEFVSANPTGPLHAAHARGAVIGDALAGLLERTGRKVTREFYVNDAGNQVAVLGCSTYIRYKEALGEVVGEIPAGLYPGEYLKDVGAAIAARDGRKWLDAPEAEWLPMMRDFAIAAILSEIKADLQALGIHHDVFSSERAVIDAGAVEKALNRLQELGLLYEGVLEPPKGKTPEDWEPRPQLLFRSTDYGDDVDRPLKKSDGTYTYFASDIAYHYDKLVRGSPVLIDVLGADHGGYVKRMQAAVKAISAGEAELDVKICQMVSVLDNGVPVKMSKRAGTFITLRDMIDRVGRDVVRFIMLTRRNDQAIEFDYAKVTEQSKDNPVFYVQYAHARCCSVMRNAATAFGADLTDSELAGAVLSRTFTGDEIAVVKTLAAWPRALEMAADAHEPHRVAFYVQEVAAAFHALWTKGKEDSSLRFIHENDIETTRARLALVRGVASVIACGLETIGVKPLEELRA